ncbi:glycoside hydrolase family 88 protein [Candidatus Woesearchaeota archaeon]|nr:glycoside hydrolase family 88 protein [Candidatus Woesearchaeota archaeon]
MRYLKYALHGLKPSNFYIISSISLRNFLNKKYNTYSNDVHIKAAMEWLANAQKATGDGGASAMHSLIEGWTPSYVETTGYIIPTFFNYAEISKNPAYRKMAVEMAEFELENQLPSGAFPGAGRKDTPIVFNTGQVIFGLCRAYQETKDEKYKKAAEKAADWLVSVMDNDGCWRKNDYLNHIHTYNTRTAWALLNAHKITANEKYKESAAKNIDWALAQQLENGWFENNGFFPEQEPLVHTIAYSIRGILESAIYLRKKKYLESAIKAAKPLAEAQRNDGSLAGSFNKEWESSVKWSCLTGNSQMSIIWQKIYMITKDEKFLDAAKKSNAFMKSVQDINSPNPAIRGAIPGAFPIYGWYAPLCFPNWAAKFFADALMLESDRKIAEKLA